MRYVPVASTDYVERDLSDGFTAETVALAPSLAWNRDDALQDMLVRDTFRRIISRRVHYVPTADGFGSAVRAGLGWGMYPEQLAAPSLADGSSVRISAVHLDVPLFWQCWKLESPMVKAITDAVRSAAVDRRRHRNSGSTRAAPSLLDIGGNRWCVVILGERKPSSRSALLTINKAPC